MKDLTSVIELIKSSSSLRDLLVSRGRISGVSSEEQFSCMFHGVDLKKSSRYYRDTDTAYCWVCKEKWDIISFTQRLEGVSFPQAINYLIKSNHIDTSKLPDTPEAEVIRLQSKKRVCLDERKLKIDRLHDAIMASRDEVPLENFNKFVYTYMMLKYSIPEDKFLMNFDKLREAMLRSFNKK